MATSRISEIENPQEIISKEGEERKRKAQDRCLCAYSSVPTSVRWVCTKTASACQVPAYCDGTVCLDASTLIYLHTRKLTWEATHSDTSRDSGMLWERNQSSFYFVFVWDMVSLLSPAAWCRPGWPYLCFLNLEIKGLQHETRPKAHLYGIEPAVVGTVQLVPCLEANGKGWLQLQSQAVHLADCVALFKDSLYWSCTSLFLRAALFNTKYQ